MTNDHHPRRRTLLTAAAITALMPSLHAQPRAPSSQGEAARAAAASAHFPFGPVLPPRPVPAWPVTTHLGQAGNLRGLLQGRLTALQLMFTGCSATCPIQGAIFAQAQQQLGTTLTGVQFLSLSIDPLSDSPPALANWLKRLGARPGWLAATPRVQDVDSVFELLAGPRAPGRTGPDPHTGQIYFMGRRGELIYRSADLPPPEQVVQTLRELNRAG